MHAVACNIWRYILYNAFMSRWTQTGDSQASLATYFEIYQVLFMSRRTQTADSQASLSRMQGLNKGDTQVS